MSAQSRFGGPNPPLDGLTPVFEEMGADPRIPPGADRPPASVAKIGTLYLSKCGLPPTDWAELPCSVVEGFGISTFGNTAGQTGTVDGTVVLVGSGNVTLSQATGTGGATISILVTDAYGVSTAGNTLGTTGLHHGQLVLAGISNITLSQATDASGVTVSIIGQTSSVTAAQLAVRAGTQDATQGTVVFSNSNGVQFGMSGSSRVTASIDAVRFVSAGTQNGTGSQLALADSNGISFGLSGSTRVTASMDAVRFVSAGTQNGTGPQLALADSNGISFGLSGSSQVTASFDGVRFVSAGTQNGTGSQLVLADSNGVTFGLSGSSQITASVAAGATATGNLGALILGTQTATSGTVSFSNTNGISFGLSGSTLVTASHNAVQEVGAQDFGGGAGINVGIPRWVWASSAGFNVAFTKSIGAGASSTQGTILAHAQAAAPAAGTQTATSGTVVFSDSNGFSFGMSGSSRVTASFDGVRFVSAGTQNGTGSQLVLADSNGVTFGLSGSSQITASVAAGATATGNLGAISAGTTFASSGTVFFANTNGVSFGMNTGFPANSITCSVSAVSAVHLQATTGTVIYSPNTLVFSDSNGFRWGAGTDASGRPAITLSQAPISQFYNNGFDRGVLIGDVSQGTIHVAPMFVPRGLDATRADQIMNVSNVTNGGATVTMRLAIYTMSGSTASRVSSTSRVWSYTSNAASSSYTQVSGTRYRSMGLGTWAFTPGQYLLAAQFSVATTGASSGTHQPHGGRDVSIVGNEYPLALGTGPAYFNGGFFSVTSGGMPASMVLSDIVSTGSNDVVFVPFVTFAGTF